MRYSLFFFLTLICFNSGIFAQSDELTIREVWCGMDNIAEPNVREFTTACEQILGLFPTPQEAAQMPIKQKLYMNKMRGALKRGATWDKLSVQARNDLAEFAINLTNEYLDIEDGQENKKPAEYQRGEFKDLEYCMSQKFEYSAPEMCYADCEYNYRDCMKGPRSSTTVQSFWCVLDFLACVVDCDVE